MKINLQAGKKKRIRLKELQSLSQKKERRILNGRTRKTPGLFLEPGTRHFSRRSLARISPVPGRFISKIQKRPTGQKTMFIRSKDRQTMHKKTTTSTRKRTGPSAGEKRIRARYGKGEITLRKIRDAAISEISEKGYHRTSVCEIVRKARLTRGAFYNYWDSLDDCLVDLLNAIPEENGKNPEFSDSIPGIPHPSRTVQSIVQLLTLVVKKNWRAGYVLLALMQEKDLPGKALKKKIRESLNQFQEQWIQRIEEDQKNRIILPDVNPGMLAVAIMSQMGMLLHFRELKYLEMRELQENAFLHMLDSVLTESCKKKYTLKKLVLDRI